MLTDPWTLGDTWFSSVFYAFTVLEMEESALSSVKTMFCYWKTLVNNEIQTVFPFVNRTLNSRKTVVFLELTVKENCQIMERILQFADSKTTRKRWIFFSENIRKCVNNAAFSNLHNLFSERVNTTFFAVHMSWDCLATTVKTQCFS